MSLQIRNTTFQKGRPLIAVSLTGTTVDEIAVQCREAVSQNAQVIEWRADYYLAGIYDLDEKLLGTDIYMAMLAVMDEIERIAGDRPRIFTIRTKGQGGMLELEQDKLEGIQTFIAESGTADLIDVEVKGLKKEYGGVGGRLLKKRVDMIHKTETKVILSYHDPEEMIPPRDIVRLIAAMTKYNCDIAKVAAMAHTEDEANYLNKATAFAGEQVTTPLVTMAMGKAGMKSRITGGKYGSMMTFAALDQPSAPGQIPIAILKAKLDEFYGA